MRSHRKQKEFRRLRLLRLPSARALKVSPALVVKRARKVSPALAAKLANAAKVSPALAAKHANAAKRSLASLPVRGLIADRRVLAAGMECVLTASPGCPVSRSATAAPSARDTSFLPARVIAKMPRMLQRPHLLLKPFLLRQPNRNKR